MHELQEAKRAQESDSWATVSLAEVGATVCVLDTQMASGTYPCSETAGAFLLRTVKELDAVKFALGAFVFNALRRRYHNSVLGFAWSLLNPLLTMSVMALMFSLIFHRNPQQFAVYLFAGMLPWTFILESVMSGSTALTSFESFLKKIYLPKAFFPLVVVCIAAANFGFSLVSLGLLGLAVGMPVSSSLLLVPVATIILFIFNCGLALLFAIATLYLRDLTHIASVTLGALFYTMPVVYPIEQIPAQYSWIYLSDPFYHFLLLFKTIIYESRQPSLRQWAIASSIAGITMVASLALLKWKEKDIIYRL
ncbi:MAG TPA: ABC transporter permease [Candidatus Obscuribacterales bacterium]